MSWLLWLMLQGTWDSRYFFKNLISFLLDTYPEVRLLDHVVVLFLNFLRRLHIVFHSGCLHLHYHQLYLSSLFSTSLPTLVGFGLFDIAILTGVMWYLIVVFICVSLIIKDVCLFMCMLATCILCVCVCVKLSIQSFCPF